MQVLVTGATGFIGRRLVDALVADGANVRALVRDSGSPPTWRASGVSLYKGRLDEPETLQGVCEGVTAVYHLAGYAGPENGAGDTDWHWRVTLEGTRALLDEARRARVRRFVFVSTVKAMGEETDGVADENSPASPETDYGRAKRAAEELVVAANREDLQTCVLRLPPVYGPGSRGNLATMMTAVARGRFPPLPASAGKRSWVHVDDVVQALLLAGSHPAAAGQIYLVTDEHPLSAAEIYRLMRAVLGLRPRRRAVPRWVLHAAAKLGDLIGTIAGRSVPLDSSVLTKLMARAEYSSTKIARELGYRPRRSLEQYLAEMRSEAVTTEC